MAEFLDNVDVNARQLTRAALHYACDRGHIDIVKLLLKRKANPNLADTFYGATPITWASMNDHAAVVGELMSAGATGGEGMLRSSAAEGKIEMVKAILVNGKPKPEQLTAAWKATKSDAVIELLKKAGAKPPEKVEAKVEPADALKLYVGKYRDDRSNEIRRG